MIEESGSFRDPAGVIFYIHDRIFRKINKVGIDRVNFLEKKKILKESIEKNYLIQTKILNDDEKNERRRKEPEHNRKEIILMRRYDRILNSCIVVSMNAYNIQIRPFGSLHLIHMSATKCVLLTLSIRCIRPRSHVVFSWSPNNFFCRLHPTSLATGSCSIQ